MENERTARSPRGAPRAPRVRFPLVPLMWKECAQNLVSAALQQMDPLSSPSDDGIQAAVFQAFPDFYVRHMTFADSEIRRNGLPPKWVTVLVRTLAKEPGSVAVETQRPIAL